MFICSNRLLQHWTVNPADCSGNRKKICLLIMCSAEWLLMLRTDLMYIRKSAFIDLGGKNYVARGHFWRHNRLLIGFIYLVVTSFSAHRIPLNQYKNNVKAGKYELWGFLTYGTVMFFLVVGSHVTVQMSTL